MAQGGDRTPAVACRGCDDSWRILVLLARGGGALLDGEESDLRDGIAAKFEDG